MSGKGKSAATRKGSQGIMVYLLPEEKDQIQVQARRAGLSDAAYLREVGLGFEIRGVVDYEQVRELARINGDLGRLGGLLKLWLTDDARTKTISGDTIRAVLKRIESKQDEMGRVMGRIVKPRSEP